ncbi:DUF6766 family protein [Nonomuraea spiralis]|uniref:DUF6766 family protein n=1 Tax=Nonomuraea spiralis TaxID=46182 RepID=A0ABV5ILN9_9ACTN|nr:DUF6766 family protein [Nonomuraea spiralis]GGT39277.1 hypothetical protein GCM10010176_099140 [Nonomuraea spiralis]
MRLPFVVPALLLAAVGCAADPTPAARAAEQIGPYATDASPAWARAWGARLWLFGNSLGLVMGAVFVLSMVVSSIYLRQRGSPESKPVGAPHAATNVEG